MLLDEVVDDPTRNDRERLLARATGAGVIRWSPPGPYEVAFSTRLGGVSEGPYASLNLGRLTGRRRRSAWTRTGAGSAPRSGGRLERLALNRQVHSATVHQARPGARGEPGDGLWTDEPDLPVLAMTADCLPIALARVNGAHPGVAVLHAGWRGLLGGARARRRRGARRAAPRPPSARRSGRAATRSARRSPSRFATAFGRDVTRNRHVDLWTAAERALRGAGVEHVERFDLCTSCNPELFFSHRRDGEPRGVQGVIARVA